MQKICCLALLLVVFCHAGFSQTSFSGQWKYSPNESSLPYTCDWTILQNAYSGASWPSIPIEVGHPFRDEVGHLFRYEVGHFPADSGMRGQHDSGMAGQIAGIILRAS